MLKKQAIYYYYNGYNCSQCLIKAVEKVYGLSIPKQAYNMCSAVNTGFGVGGICSVLVAGIMVFGLMFDENTAKRLRICLLNEFHQKHSNINCSKLRGGQNDENCIAVVSSVADIVERLIREERGI